MEAYRQHALAVAIQIERRSRDPTPPEDPAHTPTGTRSARCTDNGLRRMKMSDVVSAYILPGRVPDPRVGLAQAQAAEKIGLSGIFLSERWESKELGSVMGALTQATRTIKLVGGLTHFGTRHPLVQAGLASTMQLLSQGRYILGFGRAVPSQFRKFGIPVLNNAGMADYADILRKLWAGKTVTYKGPAGDYPQMQLGQPCMDPPPILLGALGPKTLKLAGAHFDGVVLHPFLTTSGIARSVKIVRNAAAAAGRDAASLRIYAVVVTAFDSLTQEQRAEMLEARAVSYFMHRAVAAPIVGMNAWSEEPVQKLIEADLAHLEYGGTDIAESRRRLAQAVEILPSEWLTAGAAVGSVSHCADRLRQYLDAGADEILLHGTTPDQQGPLLDELSHRRL